MNTLAIILIILTLATVGYAQDTVDFGLWNDVQITKPINKTTDAIVGVRFDTKRDTRSFAEQRAYAGFNFKKDRFTIQPMVLFLKIFSRVPYHEVRLQTTLSYKFTAKSKVNITPKTRVEYRAKVNLPDAGRIVPIISFDKKVSKIYSVFNTDELWLPINDSRDVAKYRKRLFFGVTRNVNKHLTLDMFYLYQRDEQVQPKNNHKLGLTWKVNL